MFDTQTTEVVKGGASRSDVEVQVSERLMEVVFKSSEEQRVRCEIENCEGGICLRKVEEQKNIR